MGAHSIVLSVEALLMEDPRGTEQREEEGAEETLRVFRCDIGSRANAASGRRASTCQLGSGKGFGNEPRPAM